MTPNQEIQCYEDILLDVRELFYDIEHRDTPIIIHTKALNNNYIVIYIEVLCELKSELKESIKENINRINDFLVKYNHFDKYPYSEACKSVVISGIHIGREDYNLYRLKQYQWVWYKKVSKALIQHLKYLYQNNKRFGDCIVNYEFDKDYKYNTHR